MENEYRQYVLAARPVGAVQPSDFALRRVPIPDLADGQFLVKLEFIALEPAMRGWMVNEWDYIDPLQLGDVMRAFGCGEVVASRCVEFVRGDRVAGMFGWQEYCVATPASPMLTRVKPGVPMTASIHVLGINGLTSYFGIVDACAPAPGQSLLVSGAAGIVGSVAGQIAKILGARVVGSAGTDEKCRWLVDELGFDAAINYRTADLPARLRELFPEGVEIFFDNTGGELLDAVLGHMKNGAKIVLCGAISTYNNDGRKPPGPSNYYNLCTRRATMSGLMVTDNWQRFPEAVSQLEKWLEQGRLKYHEDILDGFERLPEALDRLFTGRNLGKQLVRV